MQDRFRVILLIIVINLILISCDPKLLYVPISNHTNSEFVMSVESLGVKQDIVIQGRSFSQESLKLKYDKIINIKVKIFEKETENIISEKELTFPGEGISSDGASSNDLFFVIDILPDEQNEYEVIYSLEAFTYGFPHK